jgi:peptidyl-prolyl cis-trans isomerase B (cyclophilin B)
MAIAALVTAFLCSPLGIILGFVAKSQIRRTGQSGNGLATAAIVVGVVSILLGVLVTLGSLPVSA